MLEVCYCIDVKKKKAPKLQWDPQFKLSDLRCCEGFYLQKVVNISQKIALVGALGNHWPLLKVLLCLLRVKEPFLTVLMHCI